MVLTALSALARSGVDPWDEAARLSQLPREAAMQRLTSIILALPNGQWARSATASIAARLIALLPVKPASVPQRQVIANGKHLVSQRLVMLLFIFFINALVFTVLRDHAQQSTVDPSSSGSAAVVSPQVPFVGSK